MTLPIISGTTIMSRRWVLTRSGFSLGFASCLALRSFLIRRRGPRLRPRLNRLRARACTTSRSCSEERSRSLFQVSVNCTLHCSPYLVRRTYWSRSIPRYENLRNARFFLSSVHTIISRCSFYIPCSTSCCGHVFCMRPGLKRTGSLLGVL
jgi:hypothetical protein